MKAMYLLIIAGLMVSASACTKSGNSINQPSIIGKWSIVSDSTYAGAGLSNHPVNYAGQSGDYFDIRADGNIYSKEGTVFDTLSYHIVSTGVVIESFGVVDNNTSPVSQIKTLTEHNLKIASPVALTPGGVFERKVNLTR